MITPKQRRDQRAAIAQRCRRLVERKIPHSLGNFLPNSEFLSQRVRSHDRSEASIGMMHHVIR